MQQHKRYCVTGSNEHTHAHCDSCGQGVQSQNGIWEWDLSSDTLATLFLGDIAMCICYVRILATYKTLVKHTTICMSQFHAQVSGPRFQHQELTYTSYWTQNRSGQIYTYMHMDAYIVKSRDCGSSCVPFHCPSGHHTAPKCSHSWYTADACCQSGLTCMCSIHGNCVHLYWDSGGLFQPLIFPERDIFNELIKW